MSRRLVLALDLIDDAEAIAAYDRWHSVGVHPPAVQAALRAGGILEMEIWRTANRLVMLVDVVDDFSWEALAARDRDNPDVQNWGAMIGRLQQPIPGAGPSWSAMTPVYRMTDHA